MHSMRLKKSDVIKTICIISGILLIALNAVYYLRDFGSRIYLYTYGPDNQTMYNERFLAKGADQDAFLRALVRDKCVEYARAVKPYSDYPMYGHDQEPGNPFSKEYYYENSYGRYFNEYAASVKVDESLPVPESHAMEQFSEDFTDFGSDNDMLRYSFMVNEEKPQYVTSYFHYTWAYNVMAGTEDWRVYFNDYPYLTMHVQCDGISDADTLVALWDRQENLYLMTREYYDSKVAGKVESID